jgi:hypothetical protein
MRWWPLAVLAFLSGCNSDTASAPAHVHVGCEAGAGCTEDFTVVGVCAQDRPHMCFCGANASAPSPDCTANAVKPPPPNAQAYCCP